MLLVPPPEWLDTQAKVDEAMQFLRAHSSNAVALDTETTGVDMMRDVPIILQLSDEGCTRRVVMPIELSFCDSVYDILRDPKIIKVGTFVKRDIHWLTNCGHHVDGGIEDTLVLDAYHDENRSGNHGLKETSRDYFGLRMEDFNDVFPNSVPGFKVKDTTTEMRIRYMLYGDPFGRFGDSSKTDPDNFQKALEYSSKDPYASMMVRNYLRAELAKDSINSRSTLLDLYDSVERPFTRVLWNMERRGITVQTGHLRAQKPKIAEVTARVNQEVIGLAGRPVLLSSPKQVADLLFGQLGHAPPKQTAKGAPSTNADVLALLAKRGCPVSAKILEIRKVEKIDGTYIDGMLKRVIQSTNRMHTTLNQHIAVTGRLTSSEPNLQNLPRPSDDDFGIREAFVAEPGYTLVVADYDQLEMKLMAHLSQDQGMLQAIGEGRDLHCNTASLMSGVPYEEIVQAKEAKEKKETLTPRQKQLLDLRQASKVIGFGIIYGAGSSRIGDELGKSREEAQTLIDKYFQALPGVKKYIDSTHEQCRRVGYVTTLLGRRRRLPHINVQGNDRNARILRQGAERQAQNLGPQGGASDLVKVAMIKAEYDPELNAVGARMLLQVHDELIFEVPDVPEYIERAKNRISYLLETSLDGLVQLSVKLSASGGSGYHWAEAK